MKKWRRLIFIGLPVLVIIGFPICEHYRGKMILARYKAKLIKAGEKLSATELAPPWMGSENGAQELMAAIGRLRGGQVLDRHYPPGMRMVGPGIAAVGHLRTNWLDEKQSYTWEQLRPELETNAAVLASLRALVKKPVLQVPLDYSMGFDLLLPHLATVKRTVITLNVDALMALHDGDNQRAFDDIAAQVEMHKMFEREPILISQLVRIAIRGISFGSTWAALQKDGWSDAQLAELQRLWQQGDFLGDMQKALQMERAMGTPYFERVRESNAEAINMLSVGGLFLGGGGGSGVGLLEDAKAKASEITRNYARIPLWRFAWSYHDEKHHLELFQMMLESARVGIETKSSEKTKPLMEQFRTACENRGFYDRCRYLFSPEIVPALSRSNLKAVQCESMRSLVLSALAVKRYQLRYGSAPETLDTLVPEFLSAVPVDYWDGKPIRYRKQNDGSFLLYSVGENCVDDGGDGSPKSGSSSFSIYYAKDTVWPKAATAEEIKAFEEKEAAESANAPAPPTL